MGRGTAVERPDPRAATSPGRARCATPRLTTRDPIALPTGGTLSYWTFFDTEPGFDFGFVEVSTNGGTTWDRVDQVNGASNGWLKRSVDLSAYAGKSILVRFRYQTDEIVDVGFFEGWFIDDIEINSANWTTIAEVPRTHLDVTRKLSGTYFYRVRGLFRDAGFGRLLQGPWSNAVDVVVKR